MIYHLDPQVKIRPASQALLSVIQIFIDLKRAFNASGRGVFIPGKTDNVKLFVPKEDEVNQSVITRAAKKGIVVDNRGLLLPSPGQGLYQLYEEELGELHGIKLNYLFEWLPRVMVNGLNLCEKAEMILVNQEVHTVLTKPFIRSICQRSDIKESVCYSTGCPLTASIADTLAVSRESPVHHIECRYDPLRQEAYVAHRFEHQEDVIA
jgi:hypothetical protein